MAIILKPVAVHGIVGNAPSVISVAATVTPQVPRTFNGTGAPSSSTLPAGNGMYNGLGSGFLMNASLYAAGSGYVVGDVITIGEGTGSQAMQIDVDLVNASGEIIDFHCSRLGNYSAYPPAIPSISGGTGTGASFLINPPAPDYYIDITSLTAPVLYVCTNGGSHSSSVWAKVSGGSGSSVGLYAINGLSNGDTFTALPLNISFPSGALQVTFSGQVTISKPARQRTSVGSENIDGVTISYSGYTADNTRTATDTSDNSEVQVCFPRYITADTLGLTISGTLTGGTAYALLTSQCVIKAASMQSAGSDTVNVGLEEIEARVWARKYGQS